VSAKACDCLKWKYKGNAHLEAGRVELAIDAYNKAALATGMVERQEGIVLLLRASAYLCQAETHKLELQKAVDELTDMVPESENVKALMLATKHNTPPLLVNSILTKVLNDGKRQEVQFRQTQFRHGLYQYALLHAAQDSLRATELLSSYPTSWLRAGEILSGLWKLKESTQYYERAIALDSSLEAGLAPVIERLKKRQDLLERARAYGWPEDTLRLALDVAG
jgi:tetratricopeptide (TPR) repeat protein